MLALSIAAAIPFLVFSILLIYGFTEDAKQAVLRELSQRTDSTAKSVSQELNMTLASVSALADSDAAIKGDHAALYELATKTVARTPRILAFSLVDSNKDIIFLTRRPFGTKGLVANQLESVARVFETGKPSASGPFPSPISSLMLTSLDVPIFHNGRVAFCIRAIFDTKTLNELVLAQELPEDWITGILDKNGFLVARSHTPEIFIGKLAAETVLTEIRGKKQGIFDAVSKEGTPIKTAFQPVPGWDWIVVIGVPAKSLNNPVESAFIRLIVFTVLSLLICGLLSHWVAKYVIRYFNAVAVSAEALRSGKQVDYSTIGVDELRDLAKRLGETTKRERKANEELNDVAARNSLVIAKLDEARRDALTGLMGRKMFFEAVDAMCKSASSKDNLKLAILFIDLDGFKAVNDSLGHAEGDKVLIHAAEILNKLTRNSDAVARLGGDEFVIGIQSNSDQIKETAKDVAKRILIDFKKIGHDISCSIGIYLIPLECTDISQAIGDADKAMYQAKRLGKNQYVLFTKSLES